MDRSVFYKAQKLLKTVANVLISHLILQPEL